MGRQQQNTVQRHSFVFKRLILSLAMLLSACVTINIYFPAAAAEKAADKVIDEVWQLPASSTAPTPPATTQDPVSPSVEEIKP